MKLQLQFLNRNPNHAKWFCIAFLIFILKAYRAKRKKAPRPFFFFCKIYKLISKNNLFTFKQFHYKENC